MKISFTNWDSGSIRREEFQEALRTELVPVLQDEGFTRIQVKRLQTGDVKSRKPRKVDSRTLEINVTDSVRPGPRVHRVEALWGWTRTGYCCRDCTPLFLIRPAGIGDPITDSRGNTVAELSGNTLNLLFGVGEIKLEGFRSSVRELCRSTAALVGHGVPLLTAICSGPVPAPSLSRTLFTGFASARPEVNRRILRLTELRRQLAVPFVAVGTDELISRIASIPEIDAISVSDDGGALVFITKVMHAYYGRTARWYEMGRFRITLPFGSGVFPVCRNITRRFRGFGHPHVDRGPDNRGWCMGQAEPLIGLLARNEIEASILLALKAIETINPEENYAEIMGGFPRAEGPAKHPDGVARVGKKVRAYLRQSVVARARKARISLHEEVSALVSELKKARGQIAMLELSRALDSRAVPRWPRMTGRRKEPVRTTDVSAHIASQLKLVTALNGVREASVTGEQFTVKTDKLTVTESESGFTRQMGPFTLTFSVSDGSVSIAGDVPHIDDASVAVLSGALPELLGSLQWVAAVSMTLAFLQEFRGSLVSRARLREFKAG